MNSPSRSAHVKYRFTQAQDDEIARVYRAGIFGGNQRLARQYGVSPSLISSRAAILGLPPLSNMTRRVTQATWQDEELSLVRRHLGKPIAKIRAELRKIGYARNERAIVDLIRRQRRDGEWPTFSELLEEQDCYLVADIMAGLGVCRDRVNRWIRKGLLKADKMKGGDGWYRVRRKDLRAFLVTYVAHWDHREIDRLWLIDVLSEDDRAAKIHHHAGSGDDGGVGEGRLTL